MKKATKTKSKSKVAVTKKATSGKAPKAFNAQKFNTMKKKVFGMKDAKMEERGKM
jgi:hypothetical protein